MKKKEALHEFQHLDHDQEIIELNKIDALTSKEISSGDENGSQDLKQIPEHEFDNDGVELSIQGSDIDKEIKESGELQSDEDKDEHHKVPSKVVRVNKTPTKDRSDNSSFDKFSHLRNDPDFKAFLCEMVDDQKAEQKTERHER